MTGSTEGRSYQLAGTVPGAGCPGLAYLGTFRNTVASTVLAGTVPGGALPGDAVPAGTWSCRSLAACLAFGASGGRATAAAVPPTAGPPRDDSSSPAVTAAAAAPITLAVIAARFLQFGAAPTWRRDTTDLRFASSQLHTVTKAQVSSRRGRRPVIAENSACQDRR
jgi:hypothetical protein